MPQEAISGTDRDLLEKLDGKPRHFHAIAYGTRNIWGVSVGVLRNLDERLYS